MVKMDGAVEAAPLVKVSMSASRISSLSGRGAGLICPLSGAWPGFELTVSLSWCLDAFQDKIPIWQGARVSVSSNSN